MVAENSPHEVFEELRRAGRKAVLLESGDAGSGISGGAGGSAGDKWTFIGIVDSSVRVPEGEAGLEFMREYTRRNFRVRRAGEPPFVSGFVGFVSYDLGVGWQGVKGIKGKRKRGGERGLRCPEAYFVFVNKVIAFKGHRGGDLQLDHADRRAGHYRGDCADCRNFEMRQVLRGAPKPEKSELIKSNLSREEYFKKIAAIKEYLRAGDTYQVNFSQRFEVPFDGDEFELYKRVTAINPSAFQFFMGDVPGANRADDVGVSLRGTVISNSPERLFRIRREGGGARERSARIIETRPIKGTVPRGHTPKEEARNEAKLLASEKERAELAMIVDLERNDIGRLCVPGTVEVNEDRVVEKYSHVMHTAANIRGVLEEKYDWYDALRALHPGGSITGCPKISTIKIIDTLEDHARSVYCGTAGYIDLSGDCDFNIMIRTMWLEKPHHTGRHTKGHAKNHIKSRHDAKRPTSNQRNRLVFHSGGGITADSDPATEYSETLHKAKAIISAIQASRSVPIQ